MSCRGRSLYNVSGLTNQRIITSVISAGDATLDNVVVTNTFELENPQEGINYDDKFRLTYDVINEKFLFQKFTGGTWVTSATMS